MERGAWWATVCGEAKSWTQLRDRAYIPTVIYNAVLVSGVKHRDSVIHTHAYSFLNMYIYTHTCVCSVASVVSDSVILWTAALQAPLSMEFSRQEYWSIGLPCPPSGDLPDPEVEPTSPVSPALLVDSLPTEQPGKPIYIFFFWEKKKKLQMNLFTKQKKAHRHRKQTYSYQRGKKGDKYIRNLGLTCMHYYQP